MHRPNHRFPLFSPLCFSAAVQKKLIFTNITRLQKNADHANQNPALRSKMNKNAAVKTYLLRSNKGLYSYKTKINAIDCTALSLSANLPQLQQYTDRNSQKVIHFINAHKYSRKQDERKGRNRKNCGRQTVKPVPKENFNWSVSDTEPMPFKKHTTQD